MNRGNLAFLVFTVIALSLCARETGVSILAAADVGPGLIEGAVYYESQWAKTVPLGTIEPNLETLVGEISGELFMLFEFWKPVPEAWKGVLQGFLTSRV